MNLNFPQFGSTNGGVTTKPMKLLRFWDRDVHVVYICVLRLSDLSAKNALLCAKGDKKQIAGSFPSSDTLWKKQFLVLPKHLLGLETVFYRHATTVSIVAISATDVVFGQFFSQNFAPKHFVSGRNLVTLHLERGYAELDLFLNCLSVTFGRFLFVWSHWSL
jgi:hypothetical protein